MANLKRALGFKTLFLLAVNGILGTEIYFIPAIVANIAGPASMISWILMAFVAILMSFYFADMVSWVPKAGGIYSYSKSTYGKFTSFITGWLTWIISNISISMLIVGALYYLLPNANVMTYVILSIIFIVFFNIINYIGIKESGILMIIFGMATIFSLLFLAFPSIFFIDINNFLPFFVFPFGAVLIANFFIAETFNGWESVACLAEEAKDAKKVLPKIMVYSTVSAIILALLVVISLLGNINWSIIGKENVPFLYFVNKMYGSDIGKIFSILVFIPIIGTAASWVVSTPRMLFAMARDNLFIVNAKKIHKKYRTPYIAIIYQTIASIIITIICIGKYITILSLILPLDILLYSITLLIYNRMKMHHKPKALLANCGPYLIIGLYAVLLYFWFSYIEGSLYLFSISVLMLLSGIPAYIAIRLQTDKKFVEKWFDKTSFLFSLYFPVLYYRRNQRNEIIYKMDIEPNNNILDYGCGIGATTEEIAKRLKNGKVVALDISKKQLGRTIKRIENKLELPNVIYVKANKAAPFESNTFDRVVGVLSINYFVNPIKELSAIRKSMKRNGKAVFLAIKAPLLSIHRFLLNDSDIKTVFTKAGFKDIKIEKEKGFMKTYIYITAKK